MALFTAEPTWAGRTLCISDTGVTLKYGDLDEFFSRFTTVAEERSLGFILCENIPGVLVAYLAALRGWAVPVLLDARIEPAMLQSLIDAYQPAWVLLPNTVGPAVRKVLGETDVLMDELDCQLLGRVGVTSPPLHPDLAVLLTTSGSTGSPKMVRQTYGNLLTNAHSIMEYLCLSEDDRPITTLPMNYTYGLSVIQSHSLVGATILMTTRGVLEPEFWDFFKKERATSFYGVPYTYQLLDKMNIADMSLPSLRTMTQAGGKLSNDLHRKFAQWAKDTDRRFYVMYGQCEATARMGFLPWQRSLDKIGSIGIAIPGGTFHLEDEAGELVLDPGQVGELCYRGPNVALGYATCAADLALPDQMLGRLHTGDLAKRDEEGYYYIVGRKNRDVSLMGNRINLDDAEQLLAARFPEGDFACIGDDKHLTIYTAGFDAELAEEYLSQVTHLPRSAFRSMPIAEIPRNEVGKVVYPLLTQTR